MHHLSRSLRQSFRRVSTRQGTRGYHASVLPSLIQTGSPEFQAKAEAMDGLVADLEAKLAAARQGGGAKAADRMRSKGKLLPRERCVVGSQLPRICP